MESILGVHSKSGLVCSSVLFVCLFVGLCFLTRATVTNWPHFRVPDPSDLPWRARGRASTRIIGRQQGRISSFWARAPAKRPIQLDSIQLCYCERRCMREWRSRAIRIIMQEHSPQWEL